MTQKQIIKKAPVTLIYFGLFWLAVELISIAAPVFLPDTWYFKGYLSDTAEEKTTEFLNHQNATIPDKDLGWTNKKNISLGPWVIDEWGGRHHRSFTKEKPSNTYRAVVLGSSLMNGNNIVDNNGTISAFLDQALNKDKTSLSHNFQTQNFEVLNFATMMYGLDQISTQVKTSIQEFQPDMIIIGLHEEPAESLRNVYIPFRLPEEENMPYVKPYFELKNNTLTFHQAPLKLLDPLNQETLEYFHERDHFYYNFSRFQHFGLMPVGDQLSQLYLKAKNMLNYWDANDEDFALLRALMADLQVYADEKNIKIVYAYLPTPRGLDRGGIWKFMPDFYEQRYEWLKKPWSVNELSVLKKIPATQEPVVIDIRQYFRQSGLSTDQLYDADYFHFSRKGNEAIADAVEKSVFINQ